MKINITHPEGIFNSQVQKYLLDYSHATEVWYGGASSGKSHGVVQKVVLKSLIMDKPARKLLFLRKTDRTIADSIYQDVKDCLSDLNILSLCTINKTSKQISLPNGAIYMFRGMQDPERIKSIKGISDIIMEEASEFTKEDYTQLTLRLRERKYKDKQIFLMFNPVSKLNWTYKQWFSEKSKYDKNDIIIHNSTYKDNKFLDKHTIKTIEDLKYTNPNYYQIYSLGKYTAMGKKVYNNVSVKRLNGNSDELRNLPDYFGLDFGYMNDPSALVHVKVDMENKKLYFIDEYVAKHKLNNELADVVKELGYQKEIITADSSEKKSIEEMRRLGIDRIRPAKKGPDSIRQGIAFLQQFKFIVDDRCTDILDELDNYTYIKDKKTNEYTNEPVDSFNHCMDATRYAVEEINGNYYNNKMNLLNGSYI